MITILILMKSMIFFFSSHIQKLNQKKKKNEIKDSDFFVLGKCQ